MSRDEFVTSLLQLKPMLVDRGITHVAIHGSRARCDSKADSDLDLLVEIDRTKKFSLLDFIGVEHLVGDTLRITAHASENSSLELKFAQRIKRDLVDVF